MSTLYLLRHSKAVKAAAGMRDFDRPLENRGRNDAAATGEAMRAQGFFPDATLCSGARRTRETLDGIRPSVRGGEVVFMDQLFSADADGYVEAIRDREEASVLVIGHNPMMEEVTLHLTGGGEEAALASLAQGFPTSGLAVIRFHGPLSAIRARAGTLVAFLTPRER